MLRNRFFIILGGILAVFILGLGALVMFKSIRGSSDPSVVQITWCNENASGLCVVSFSTDSTDRMIINFQWPETDYPQFYVKGINRDIANIYSCEADLVNQTSTHCIGVRTPLGETIDVEVYSTDGDIIIARGRFVVSALLVSTPIIAPPSLTPMPTQTSPALPVVTPNPGTAYPNP